MVVVTFGLESMLSGNPKERHVSANHGQSPDMVYWAGVCGEWMLM